MTSTDDRSTGGDGDGEAGLRDDDVETTNPSETTSPSEPIDTGTPDVATAAGGAAIPVAAGGGPGGVPRAGASRRSRFRREAGNWPVVLSVVLIATAWLLPTVGLLITSFRPRELVDTTGWWTVFGSLTDGGQWTLENYRTVLDAEGFGNSFLNSLAVTIPATAIPITIASFAAYAFSWMEFRGRQVLFAAVVGLMVVPLQMSLIPILRLYTSGASISGVPIVPDLDLNGTLLAVWLAHTGFGLPLATYMLRNYIGSLPRSLIESAKVDGASHFTTFTRLVLPLSTPILASFAIFQFLWVWNDLLVALVFLGGEPDVRVVTQALRELNGSRGQAWHLLTAGAFVSMVLPLVVFFSLQRYFVSGLTAGAVKE